MNQEYFQKWTEMTKNFQKPLQSLTELNLKTMQQFSYLKPEDLATLKKPEQLLEKQVELAIQNGHNALEYMRKSFEIMEKALFFMNESVKGSSASLASTLSSMGNSMKMPGIIPEATDAVLNAFDPTHARKMPKPLFTPKLAEAAQAGAKGIKSSNRKTRKKQEDGNS